MKRASNLYEQIISIGNLELADRKASKGKDRQYGVQVHRLDQDENIWALHKMLRDKTYRTSAYTTFKIYEPKEREIFRLPYFPDRITHHAVMNVLEPIFISSFISQTYSCIKGKGIHAAARGLRKALNDESATTYCLKLDIRKFYPSIDHEVLKTLLRRKFKDAELLWLLNGIIDSAEGLPIGNYLSQYFANFYLTYFDHWIKEVKGVRYYFRYADDLVVLSDNKADLHLLLSEIKLYLQGNLKLTVKSNYQIFPVKARGIDFVGYVFYHTHTRLRKSIKQNFARMIARRKNSASIASYYGWAKHCNSKTLLKKLLYEQVPRLQYKSRNKNLRWRQDENRAATEPQDISTRFQTGSHQNRKVQGFQRPMPQHTIFPGRHHVRTVHQFKGIDRPDTESG
jgi:RNA-directed DNA polymerase